MDRGECPPTGDLAGLVAGDLPADVHERVAQHVEWCAACQGRLDQLLSDDSVTSWTRATSARSAPGPDPQFVAEMRTLVPRVAMSPVALAPAPGGPVQARADGNVRCPAAVGGYEILGELGRGGMAVVYKARQPRVGRVVALKRLRFADQDAADTARFLREAEAAARVRHPNVVQVYEVGDEDGRPFLALEYVDGGTLADALSGSPVDPRTAAGFIEKAARAVHTAHQQGVVHRDLKPANILLARETDGKTARQPTLAGCEPKVTDFGLARRMGDDRRVTLPDMLAGTPAYLAPEQVSRPADAATPAGDIYALGAILYEMLTGRPPLLGPTVLATLRLVEAAAPVSPRRLQPGLPRDLEAVCLKCLEKEPRRRYATAAALADDLDRFLTGRPTEARPLSLAGRASKLIRRYPIYAVLAAVIAVSVVAGLAGVLWQWRAAVAARSDLSFSLATEAEHRWKAEQSLYIASLAQANTFWESGEAARARALLAACRPAAGQADLRGWEWNYLSRQFHAESRIIPLDYWVNDLAPVSAGPGEAPELAVAIGQPRLNRAYKPSPADGRAGFLNPLVDRPAMRPGPDLPGAATSVSTVGAMVAWGTNSGHIVLADRASGRLLRTIAVPAPVTYLSLTSDGRHVIAAMEDAHCRSYVTESGELVGDAAAPVGAPGVLALNPTGTRVACGGNKRRIAFFDVPDLRPAGELVGPPSEVTAVTFFPDGQLAVGGGDGSVGVWNLAAARETRRFRFDNGPIYALAFRADDSAIAVAGADRTVRLIDPATYTVLAAFRGHEGSVRSLAFVADGKMIVSGAQDGTVRVWDATHDHRGRRLHFDSRLNEVAFCPTADGLLIHAAALGGNVGTWSVADGRAVARRTLSMQHRPAYPIRYMAFVAGGRQLAGFERADAHAPAVWDVAAGDRLARFADIRGMYYTIAADPAGRRFAWATAATGSGVDVWWSDPDGPAAGPVHIDAPAVRALAVDPTGERLAAVGTPPRPGEDQTVWVIDTAGRTPPRFVAQGGAMLGAIAFSPDGRLLAVVTRDVVQVYDTDTGNRVHEAPCAPATTCLAFSPDGRRLAAVGYDGVVTLYDPLAGKQVFRLRGLARSRPDDMAADARVAFSPDGNWLVSTNWDGSLNVWDGRQQVDVERLTKSSSLDTR